MTALLALLLLTLPMRSSAPAYSAPQTQDEKPGSTPSPQEADAKNQEDAKAKAAAEARGGKPEVTPSTVTPAVTPAQPPKGAAQPANPARPNPQGRGATPRGVQPAPVSSATGGAPQTPAQVGQVPAIQEAGDFYILNLDETGEGIDLEWLTKMCQVATGKNFVYDEPVAGLLKGIKVRMFGEKRIPKAEFYSFYQILMFIHQFTLTKVGPDHLAVYLVQALTGGPAKSNLRNEALYLLPEELDRYADQVATQVITVMHLPHTDVRTLGNSLRGLTSDPTNGQGVLPVGNTNSVILQGFASNVASLAHILRLVDDESAKDIGIQPMFEVIPLEFAAAEDLSDILGELLEASKRQQQQNRQAAAQGATGQIAQTGGGETKILTYPRTNSLLVMALPDDMQAIKELVARLDVEVVEPERTYHVYVLEHVKAKDLAEVLKDFIEGASRVGGSSGGGGNRAGGQAAAPQTTGLSSRDNEVVVVPDEATNSLLIAASRRRYEEVLELIQRLDHRAEQVLIETALIELSGKDNLDIGVELGGADLPGSGTGSFGVTSFGLSTFDDTDGDGIPDIRTPNQSTGITAGILNGGNFSLPVLVYALRDRNDTNVLNIPSVLVNNNGSATVKTLDEQPTTNITSLGGTGAQTQQSFGEYQKAGITMQISPSISMSGYLRLDISLEVSNFTGTFSANGNVPPPRITRTIATSVSVPNGDTMVIGGIIVDDKNESRRAVPFLGDLPILGYLFRRDTDNKNRTTLYFFVTPHILKDHNFADLAEISYKLKLDAAEKIGTNRMQLIDRSFGAATGEIDLDGFEVPMYRSPGGGEVTPGMVGKDPVTSTKALEDETKGAADTKPGGN